MIYRNKPVERRMHEVLRSIWGGDVMKPLLPGIGFLMLSGLVTFARAPETLGDIPRLTQMTMGAMCPATLPFVEIAALDTTNGIAVTFSATGANIPELQKRVEHLANMPM